MTSCAWNFCLKKLFRWLALASNSAFWRRSSSLSARSSSTSTPLKPQLQSWRFQYQSSKHSRWLVPNFQKINQCDGELWHLGDCNKKTEKFLKFIPLQMKEFYIFSRNMHLALTYLFYDSLFLTKSHLRIWGYLWDFSTPLRCGEM